MAYGFNNDKSKADMYTQPEANALLDAKANASNVYTKSEVDAKISALKITKTQVSFSAIYSSNEKLIPRQGSKSITMPASSQMDVIYSVHWETYPTGSSGIHAPIGGISLADDGTGRTLYVYGDRTTDAYLNELSVYGYRLSITQ